MKRMTKIVSMLALYIATFLQSFAQTDFFTQEKALSAADIVAGKLIAFKGISGTNSQWINWEKASTSTPVKAGLYEVEGAPSGTGIVLKRQIDNKYIGISTAITNNKGEITGYNIQMVENKENAVAFTVSAPELNDADVTGIHDFSLPGMTGSMTQNQTTAEKQAVLQTSWAYGKQIRLTANIDGSDFYTNIQTGGTGIPRLANGKGSWSVIMAYDASGYTPIAFNGYYRIISGLQGFESTQGAKKAMYDAENGEYRWNTLDETLPQFIWDITMNDFGEMTIKNYYSEQYMSGMGTIGEEPAVVKFNDLGNNEFNLIINNQTMHAAGHASGAGNSGNIISWAGGANSASSWKLEAVDQEIADEINLRFAFTSLAKEALNELQTNYSYTVDADFNNALVNDASRITSNATYPGNDDGEGIPALIDGNFNTYWHSDYKSSSAPKEQHYLQFDLGAEQEALAITYWKRQNSGNYPTTLTFLVSNDATNWKTVKQIENLDTSAPTTENPGYTSKGFSLFGSYRYLRVLLQSNSSLVNGYSYTHFSEFRIHPVTANGGANSVIDQSLITEVLNKIDAGNNNDNISETDINNLRTAFNNYKIAAQKYNYTKLVDDLNTAGKLAEDPAIGQYNLTKANELKALCASTDATLDQIEAAYTAFHASLNAYVFTINSAYTGYPNGSSIYDNNSGTLYWKQTNKYDKSMLWKFEDAAKNNITVGEYVVTNMATGNKFWDADFISVTASTAEGISNALTFRTNGTGKAIHAQQNNSEVVRYGDETSQASAWTFEYVGESKDIDAVDEAQLADYAALKTLITECEPYSGKIGEGLNKFSCKGFDFESALTDGKTIATQDIYENPTLDATSAKKALQDAKDALAINQPETGKYYRIKSVIKNKYVSSKPVADGRQSLIDDGTDPSTVYYLSEDNRLTNSIALNIGEDSHPAKTSLGTTFEFLINNNGYYLIKSTERVEPLYPHNDGGDLLSYDWKGGSFADKLEDAWILEEVTDEASLPKLTKTITGEYATLAAPVSLVIPERIKAYKAQANGDKATLTEVTGIIPAGTAVVLQKTGEGNDYVFNFDATAASQDESNNLVGVYAETAIPTTTNAYVLAQPANKNIGFYLLDATDRTIAANKAYLVVPAEASGIKAFTFDFGGTTGIENTEAVTETEEYYDLQGRRVMNPTKGIYVTKSGKKVLFTK